MNESSTEGARTLGTRLGYRGNSLLVRLFIVAVAIGLFRLVSSFTNQIASQVKEKSVIVIY